MLAELVGGTGALGLGAAIPLVGVAAYHLVIRRELRAWDVLLGTAITMWLAWFWGLTLPRMCILRALSTK